MSFDITTLKENMLIRLNYATFINAGNVFNPMKTGDFFQDI